MQNNIDMTSSHSMSRNEVLEWLKSIQENYAMQDETQEVAQAVLQAIEDVKAMAKIEQIVKSTTTRIVYERKFEEVKQIVNETMQKEQEPEEVEVTSCVGCIHSKESEPTAYNCATCEKFSNYDSEENYKE